MRRRLLNFPIVWILGAQTFSGYSGVRADASGLYPIDALWYRPTKILGASPNIQCAPSTPSPLAHAFRSLDRERSPSRPPFAFFHYCSMPCGASDCAAFCFSPPGRSRRSFARAHAQDRSQALAPTLPYIRSPSLRGLPRAKESESEDASRPRFLGASKGP